MNIYRKKTVKNEFYFVNHKNSIINPNNNSNKSMREIQQFCLDIKNNKKYNNINNTQSSFNNCDLFIKSKQTESILLDESEESTESINNYNEYSYKKDGSNVINQLINILNF